MRRIVDENFREWEAYASAGRFGLPDRAYILFHCLTDRSLTPRYVEDDGDKAIAERRVATASDRELLDLLHRAREFKPAEQSPEGGTGGVPPPR
jgi:hypothetical protein